MKLSINWEACIADGFFLEGEGGGRIIFGTWKAREGRNSPGGDVEKLSGMFEYAFPYFSQMKNTIGL